MVYFILLNRNLLCSKYVCSKFNTISVYTHLGCFKVGQCIYGYTLVIIASGMFVYLLVLKNLLLLLIEKVFFFNSVLWNWKFMAWKMDYLHALQDCISREILDVSGLIFASLPVLFLFIFQILCFLLWFLFVLASTT